MTTYSPDIAPELEPEVVHWQKPTARSGGWRGLTGRGRAAGADSLILVGIGAMALGAFAVGAAAVGALAIGRLAIGKGYFRRLEIDELVVHRVRAPQLRLPWRG